jgi:5-methylcytosine-specific restriction enzyme subunit McrC
MELAASERRIGQIPVKNLWFLMLYASDLTRFGSAFNAMVDDDFDEIPDLIARLLAGAVGHRLRRNFTRGFKQREGALTRVRGRINLLTTESRQLLSRGEVFCLFEELTVDTPRNRFVRAALDLLARLVRDNEMARHCRALAVSLGRLGVGGMRPDRAELSADQVGRNDAPDRFMVSLARLAFELALPSENPGARTMVSPEREEAWVRRLFEKAILGFSRVELEPLGWSIRGGIPLNWQVSFGSDRLAQFLPRMLTDIVLDPPDDRQRLIIDTKFTSILSSRRFGNEGFKSGYIYQMYAYLRSQEGRGQRWEGSAGLFLHPAVGIHVNERVVIQNHSITFATVNLSSNAKGIRDELRSILSYGFWA